MNKCAGRLWNIALLVLGFAGAVFFATAFAKAIAVFSIGKCVICFMLTSVCLETFVFSLMNLLKNRK